MKWTVIGAGPAGIVSIGKLLDAGVLPEDIAWVDPFFKAGDFGTVWKKVQSNGPITDFAFYYQSCQSFLMGSQEKPFFIEHMNDDKRCPLVAAAEPLRWITNHLRKQVTSYVDTVTQITPAPLGWTIQTSKNNVFSTEKIILAIGADAKTLDFPHLQTIPLNVALDPESLAKELSAEDSVVVFGSAQSAANIVESLAFIKTRKVVHFYRKRESFDYHLSQIDLSHVESLSITPSHLLKHIPSCNKAIYAIGFQKRQIPIGCLSSNYSYDRKTGEIAPGIFGLGIAFPEILLHRQGEAEYEHIVIPAFCERLDELLPRWVTSPTFTTEEEPSFA
jgi:hypothetical protein